MCNRLHFRIAHWIALQRMIAHQMCNRIQTNIKTLKSDKNIHQRPKMFWNVEEKIVLLLSYAEWMSNPSIRRELDFWWISLLSIADQDCILPMCNRLHIAIAHQMCNRCCAIWKGMTVRNENSMVRNENYTILRSGINFLRSGMKILRSGMKILWSGMNIIRFYG